MTRDKTPKTPGLNSKLSLRPSRVPWRKNSKLVFLAALLLLLSACGDLTPNNNKIDQLLINEVYTGAPNGNGYQWIELLNNTNDPLPLEGYRLETPHGVLDLGALTATSPNKGVMAKGSILVLGNYPKQINDQVYKLLQDAELDETLKAKIPRPPMPVEDRSVVGKLDPARDVIVLRDRDGLVLDQLGWGGVDQGVKSSLGIAKDVNMLAKGAPDDNKSMGRTPHFGQPPGQINPGEFTIHNTPTPGINTTPRSATSKALIFTTATDIIATIGGALLWIAFFIIALVAKRFETLSEQKTYWQFLMIAPAGILIYVIIQVGDFIIESRLTDFWSVPAFLSLFVSGLACLYVINIFRLIAKNILEAE